MTKPHPGDETPMATHWKITEQGVLGFGIADNTIYTPYTPHTPYTRGKSLYLLYTFHNPKPPITIYINRLVGGFRHWVGGFVIGGHVAPPITLSLTYRASAATPASPARRARMVAGASATSWRHQFTAARIKAISARRRRLAGRSPSPTSKPRARHTKGANR